MSNKTTALKLIFNEIITNQTPFMYYRNRISNCHRTTISHFSVSLTAA